MEFRRMQWLFPIAVTLHNTEEAISLPAWTREHALRLPVNPPGALKFRLALLVLTVAAFVITYWSARKGPRSLGAYLLFGCIIAMLANVLVPHVPAAIAFQGYAPGVVTAVLINLPLMYWLAALAIREGWVAGWKAIAFAVGIPVGLGFAIIAFFAPKIFLGTP